jgi:hypothetical protein
LFWVAGGGDGGGGGIVVNPDRGSFVQPVLIITVNAATYTSKSSFVVIIFDNTNRRQFTYFFKILD